MLWKKNHERQFEGSKVCHTKTTSGFFLLIDYKRELKVSILSFTFSNYFNSLCKKIGLYMCNPKKITQSKSVSEHMNILLDGTWTMSSSMNDTVQGGGGSWISQYPLNLISIQLFTFFTVCYWNWNVQFYLWIKYILRV